MRIEKPTLIALIAIATGGCATTEGLSADVKASSAEKRAAIIVEQEPVSKVTEEDGIHISAVPVEYVPPPKGAVTMRASNLPLASVLSGLSDGAGLSISYLAGVDTQRPVTIDLREVEPNAAIREVAASAGYVAVFDRPGGVSVAKEAAYTFRIPPHMMQTLTSTYSISNATSLGQSGGASNGGGGNIQQNVGTGTGNQGTSSAQVRINGSTTLEPSGLKNFLSALSGATLVILPEEGLISARGAALQLKRLAAFLDGYVRDGLTQIDIELSVVEVALINEFQTGIDWSRIIPANGAFGRAAGAVSLRTGLAEGSDAMTVQSTSKNIDSVLRGLERVTRVSELTRPRLLAMNHVMKMQRYTVQRPYLPSATTNTQTGSSANVIQNSASVGYTEDGVSFAVQPHVLDAHRTQLKLMPVLTSTQAQATFSLGKDVTLVAPIQQRQDAHLEIVAEHGKTMVISGLRTSAGRGQVGGAPGLVNVPGLNLLVGGHDDRTSAREVVMLLHTRIIPAPSVSTIVGESI